MTSKVGKTTESVWMTMSAARQTDYQGRRYVRIDFAPCEIKQDGKQGWWNSDQPFADLGATIYLFQNSAIFIHPKVAYGAPVSVTLDRAQIMVQTLRTIEKRLAQYNEKNGYCQTLGQWVLRFIRACEADGLTYNANGGNVNVTNGTIVSTVDAFIHGERKWVDGKD